MDGTVLVVGSYNQDHVWHLPRFPTPGETVLGNGFATGAGGKGFNQATAAARQGAPTVFIGARGDDALGRLACTSGAAAGIQCRWQVCGEAATGSAAILVDADSQNQVIVTPGANARLAADFVREQMAQHSDARVLLLQLETNFAALRAALEYARAQGALRILNPAPFHPGLDAALLQQCNMLTPNESEFAQLLAHLDAAHIDPADVAALADAELHALCRRLHVPTVIVTLGRRGCFVSHGETQAASDNSGHYRVPAAAVHTIDTTGAGDAFNGALAAALLRWPAAPLSDSVQHASRAAALSTERHGAAASMVDFAAVTARFATAP